MMCSRVEPDVHCRKNLQKSVVGPIDEDGCSHIIYHINQIISLLGIAANDNNVRTKSFLKTFCKHSKYVSILKYK